MFSLFLTSNNDFPAFSKIQDDIPRLRNAYLKVFRLTSFLACPCAGLIFIFSHDFVLLVLGSKWAPIIPVMQILAIKGLERSLGATGGPLFEAVGKPGISTKLQFAKLIMLIILIYPVFTLCKKYKWYKYIYYYFRGNALVQSASSAIIIRIIQMLSR